MKFHILRSNAHKRRRQKRLSGLSVITGGQYAWHVSRKISRFAYPDKYFISFPYGMFSPWWLKDHRPAIRTTEKNFYARCGDKWFKDGSYLPFTLLPEDFLESRRLFRKNEVKGYDVELNKLPAAESWTGRYLHTTLFLQCQSKYNKKMQTRKDYAHLDPEEPQGSWYYDVSSWEGLRTYKS